MSEKYAELIEHTIKDALGPVFAKSAIKVACRQLGVEPEAITRDDIEKIAEKLEKSLNIAFGDTVAASVAEKVKKL